MGEVAGYSHPAYAATLTHIGAAHALDRSGGSILVRRVPGTEYLDACGPYPLFCCSDWAGLPADLDEPAAGIVSLVIVPDPFCEIPAEQLARWFPDWVAPFKTHHVVDLTRDPERGMSRHHRRDAAHALRHAEVEVIAEPVTLVAEWLQLYRALVARRGVAGPAAFSETSLERQLRVPGVRAFRASKGGSLLGIALWYVDRAVAYYHLAACTDEGYAAGASYALVATALRRFADDRLEWASLGGGVSIGGADGLTRFKAGWTDIRRATFVCGKVFQGDLYAQLCREAPRGRGYFPEYRAPGR